MKLFTIGFTKKSAETFFTMLRKAGVRRVLDVRLNNRSQLAGFAKGRDLEYFLREICGIDYLHLPDLAPTRQVLDRYRRREGTWSVYERELLDLIRQRRIEDAIPEDVLDRGALLCSEDDPHHCHRRLVAEYLRERRGDVEIVHLGSSPRTYAPPTRIGKTPTVPSRGERTGPTFAGYIGIDYSGAQTPKSSLPGLRIFMADRESPPVEVPPPPSPRKYWTRQGIAAWLAERLPGERLVVGIDHGFSFPLRYFEKHRLAPDWAGFLDDFQHYWPTDEDNIYVDFVRDRFHGDSPARSGSRRWRRLTEKRAGAAKSVFHFDVPGTVAKSTHAGLPWLRYLRQRVGHRVHFWPFDGWSIPADRSAIAEVYPSLWSRSFPREGRTGDQHDAFSIASWLRRADLDGSLADFLDPPLTPSERTIAEIEGWILGVP